MQGPPVQIANGDCCDHGIVIAGREEDGGRAAEIIISLKNLNSKHASSSSPVQPTLLLLSKFPHLDFILLEKETLQEAACVPLVFLSKARREGMLKLSRWLGNCPPSNTSQTHGNPPGLKIPPRPKQDFDEEKQNKSEQEERV